MARTVQKPNLVVHMQRNDGNDGRKDLSKLSSNAQAPNAPFPTTNDLLAFLPTHPPQPVTPPLQQPPYYFYSPPASSASVQYVTPQTIPAFYQYGNSVPVGPAAGGMIIQMVDQMGRPI
ncbi:hypothetical protein HK104_009230, partial [Borealophlyctis nickersoniae]